jgi:predicted permease
MSILLPTIVPIALIILLGFIAGHTLTPESQTLSQLTIYILFPALIAHSLAETTLSAQNSSALVLGFLITSGLLYLLAQLSRILFQLPSDLYKSLLATTLFANTGNLGLPFITFALGQGGLERAIVYLIAGAIFMSSVGPGLLKSKGIGFGLRITLKLPIFWAMIGGLILHLGSIELPLRLGDGIEMLSQTAIPIALLTLGIQLSQTHVQLGKYELFASVLRLVIAPLVAYGVSLGLGLRDLDLQVMVLQGAMPAAVSSLIWVKEFGGNAARVANTIVLSTLLSFLTLPLLLWISHI